MLGLEASFFISSFSSSSTLTFFFSELKSVATLFGDLPPSNTILSYRLLPLDKVPRDLSRIVLSLWLKFCIFEGVRDETDPDLFDYD